MPDLSYNPLLKELRLNDNQITEIPETLRKCTALEIIDFGNNQIKEWKDIASLGSLLNLHNLNLKGNPLAQKKDYLEKVLDLIPSLRILDGERFDPKFLQRKKKQRQNVNLVEKKQRVKRMKLQKEKKERKETGEEVVEKKRKAAEEVEPKKQKKKSEEPKAKKQKKEEDPFFVVPEKKETPKRKLKAADVAAKKLKTEEAKKPKTDEVEPKKAEKPKPVPLVPQTKAQTGVVGVVDKSKKVKAKTKDTTDIVAALENESKKETQADTGTGLDVGGWD